MASTNTALKLDDNLSAAKRINPRPVQPPELRVVQGRAERSREVFVHAAVFFVFMIAMLGAVLYNSMVLTELTSQTDDARSRYEELVNENRHMQVELESKTTLSAIRQAAEELGMAKAEAYQIEYVELGQEEEVILTQEAGGVLETVVTAVGDFISSLFGGK